MLPDPQLNGPIATTPAVANENDEPRPRRRKPMKKAKPRPDHYKVICISLYNRDLEQLTAKVEELKRRGETKMSKSELIRIALDRLNVDEVAPCR